MLTLLLLTKRILSKILPLPQLFESDAYRNGRASLQQGHGPGDNPYDREAEAYSHDQWILGRGERRAG